MVGSHDRLHRSRRQNEPRSRHDVRLQDSIELERDESNDQSIQTEYELLLSSPHMFNFSVFKGRCQSAALGWCIEFLQAFFLVADDVMDHSVTRRGAPCWFRNNDVQLIAINDSFILESCVFKILKRYFGQELYYPQLVDLFIEVCTYVYTYILPPMYVLFSHNVPPSGDPPDGARPAA